jgi:hypothetical protein
MIKTMETVIAGITQAIDESASNGCAEFCIGTTKMKIDHRGISIVFDEAGLDPVALRLYRPNSDASCWGYVLVGEQGSSNDTALLDDVQGFNIVACLPNNS